MVPRQITSLQHPIVKRLVKLRQERAFRYEERRVVVSGVKLIQEIAAQAPVKTLIAIQGVPPVPAEETYLATPEILKKISGLAQPDGLAAEVQMPPFADLKQKKSLVVLDSLADPGNVGTLLRTALSLGWEGAALTKGSADPFSDKALSAAKGATFRLPLALLSQEETATLLKGYDVFVADLQGTALDQIAPSAPVALILGNEAHGPSPEAKKLGKAIFIPMRGAMESLNVAAAGAILLYEIASILRSLEK